ncbi:hypothetical protein N7507_008153 [Penicillium longicatenatum]|nr:hypothetical protein N7507_008153 [Penicillium longicatenatum]
MSLRVTDVLSWVLIGFNVVSMQAHLTDRFTPGFSRNLAEKLPQHNRVLFKWAGISDSTLRGFFLHQRNARDPAVDTESPNSRAEDWIRPAVCRILLRPKVGGESDPASYFVHIGRPYDVAGVEKCP